MQVMPVVQVDLVLYISNGINMDNLTISENEITKEKIEERLQRFPNLLSTKEVAQQRLDICSKCSYKTTRLSFDACSLCHCFLEFKTRYAAAECPMNYWIKP